MGLPVVMALLMVVMSPLLGIDDVLYSGQDLVICYGGNGGGMVI